MPPSLEAALYREKTLLLQQPAAQTRLVLGEGVISRSPERGTSAIAKGKKAIKARTYGDGPLPVKPSEAAPRDARIVGRVAEPGKLPIFTLKVGEVEIDDVSLHEILEYVSPLELERFEHLQFVEEREALAAALAAAEIEHERRRQRRKEIAKRKGTVVFEEIDDEEAGSADPSELLGRHSRARPTYKHLFKVPPEQQRRRRRKRDPATGELLPLSDEEEKVEAETAMESSEDDKIVQSFGHRGDFISDQLPKRRRRKRDPATGELLPLSPMPQTGRQQEQRQNAVSIMAAENEAEVNANMDHRKRPRRRRHPVTGELMPLGFRYDPATGSVISRSAGRSSSQQMRRMSTSQGQQSKRVKLASESSTDESPATRQSPGGIQAALPARPQQKQVAPAGIDSSGTAKADDLMKGKRQKPAPSPNKVRSPPKTSMLRPTVRTASSETSGEPVTLASFLQASTTFADDTDSDDSVLWPKKPALRKPSYTGKTSILNPVSTKQPEICNDEADTKDESELDEGEWFVEAIVGHKLSDPRSHPGKPSVMLYHTKWEGYDELTWEPADSFVDPNTVPDYRQRVRLDKVEQAIRSPSRIVPVVASSSISVAMPQASKAQSARLTGSQAKAKSTKDDSEEDEDGYEIERILAHHISDPRTHPGKPQTMLYKVKWVGYPTTAATWEPKASFPDLEVLNAYRRKVGLQPETG